MLPGGSRDLKAVCRSWPSQQREDVPARENSMCKNLEASEDQYNDGWYGWSGAVRLMRCPFGKYVSISCTWSYLGSLLGGIHCFLCILEILCAFINMYLNIPAVFAPQIEVQHTVCFLLSCTDSALFSNCFLFYGMLFLFYGTLF